jgi:hypothetical protein
MKDTTKPRTTVWGHTPVGYKLASSAAILIVVLKLFGVQPMANWTWFWILSPFWIIGILAIVVALGMFAIFYFFDR